MEFLGTNANVYREACTPTNTFMNASVRWEQVILGLIKSSKINVNGTVSSYKKL